MADILEYLRWRGDLSLEKAPFNSADALILAEFGYVPLEGAVPESFGGGVTVREAFSQFSPDRVEPSQRILSFEQDCLLFREMARSRRFGGARLSGYTSITDNARELQFSAVTVETDDGHTFVSFRGTDGSVVGWKEDLTMSFSSGTAGQLYGVSYLNNALAGSSSPVRVGGHSKGGNLAIYASAFARPEIRSRIAQIYSFDGPGFREEITSSDGYSEILPRVLSFVPETSVVGMLLSHGTDHTVVRNSGTGIMQHLAYNWETGPGGLVPAEGPSRSGEMIERTVTGWLEELSDSERRTFTDALFGVLEAPEKGTLKEILKGKWPAYGAMIKAARELAPEQQAVLRDAMKKLARSGKEAILPKTDK
ncbi:MAG: DUF2974 domain-containing protein [Ruminococcus sp.]|nr:DUF2974 domain-containing protein [Ruminococcus sp.]